MAKFKLKEFLARIYLFLVLPAAIASTVYLYFYPVFLGCHFPHPPRQHKEAIVLEAPFRLLTLADPQIEGDGSLLRHLRGIENGDGWAGRRQEERREKRKANRKSEEEENRESQRDVEKCQSLDLEVGESDPVKREEMERQEGQSSSSPPFESEDLEPWWEFPLSLLEVNLEYFVSYIRYLRKLVDLWGNDLYLSHIYHTLHRESRPTHTVVLGDLLSSQWIADAEFQKRGRRFWDVIFRSGEKVTKEDILRNEKFVWEHGNNKRTIGQEESVEPVDYGDSYVRQGPVNWKKKVINIVGNHDVGYAGDITRERISRFEEMFGPANYMFSFLPSSYSNSFSKNGTDEIYHLRIMILNSLTLDTPLFDPSMAENTYNLLNQSLAGTTINHQGQQATILLTHLPLYKPAGICKDGPYITYFPPINGGGIREQNHLTEASSKLLLESIFGNSPDSKGQRGIILTGHDHEGCDVWHYLTVKEDGGKGKEWDVASFSEETSLGKSYGIREITVRSMMGDFSGNAGLLSAWLKDDENGEKSWVFEYVSCRLGSQHWWWVVHVIDLIAVVGGLALLLLLSCASGKIVVKLKDGGVQEKKE